MRSRLVKQQSNSVKIVPRYSQELLDRVRDRKGVELRVSICQPAFRSWCRERFVAPFLDPVDPAHQDTESPRRELLVIFRTHNKNIDDKCQLRVSHTRLLPCSECARRFASTVPCNASRKSTPSSCSPCAWKTATRACVHVLKACPEAPLHSSARDHARASGNAADGH